MPASSVSQPFREDGSGVARPFFPGRLRVFPSRCPGRRRGPEREPEPPARRRSDTSLSTATRALCAASCESDGAGESARRIEPRKLSLPTTTNRQTTARTVAPEVSLLSTRMNTGSPRAQYLAPSTQMSCGSAKQCGTNSAYLWRGGEGEPVRASSDRWLTLRGSDVRRRGVMLPGTIRTSAPCWRAEHLRQRVHRLAASWILSADRRRRPGPRKRSPTTTARTAARASVATTPRSCGVTPCPSAAASGSA